uniref:rRNA 2'-O-methyltransferase fibrillarin n=1 Tax=uncultured marine thaumarchaeote KM3_43_D05 TaxID=1456150 RepID=A0A075H4J9_9ARCH|nr:fibrillarin (flpA) [uncultured marine thaumarchaeote KM3_43_D05]
MKLKEEVIFWVTVRNEKKLATLSNVSTNQDYEENLVEMNGKQYSIWSPYTSKLAAAIINGMEIFPILKKTKILYVDPTSEKTVKHISDIVGINGKIFVVRDVMKNPKNFLEQIVKNRSNIFTIIPDKTNPARLTGMTEMVDVIYIDIVEHNQTEIAIQNCKNHLRIGGFLMLIVPTKNIDFASNPSKKNQEERKKLQTSFDIIQEINLTDFFKEYSMVIAKYLG